ncbi:ABC transporter ATP-binding protein [Ornithinibacillus californiensis]|uniref:ABC transporter ATP-binding protein n=1 Tax=Ornithinibacillus californiensis TaxID=161536 RepID=UPI00064DCD4F|nr:ABC transporter ATP-binding protein [Ornithinibacillus californiensis]
MLGVQMVQLENVMKQFDDTYVVDDLNLDIKSGEFLTLLGPSGCGKTTTLRMIAGFEKPTSGKILLNGKQVDELEPYKREVNTVFQSYSLFPHMTVFDNVAFGLKMKKVPKEEIQERVTKALKLVQLEEYGNRKPKQLSGGQQQRIAIARAIVNNPKVLLLDEPLGALDLKLRKQMQLELKHLQQTLNITFIYVTHDQEEALTMSDRIVVMNKGKIEQIGLPYEIYERPQTRFVADFIGQTNILEGTVTAINGEQATMKFADQVVEIPNTTDVTLNEEVYISVRPEKIKLSETPFEGSINLKGTFKEKIYVGSVTKIVVTMANGQDITVNESHDKIDELTNTNDVYVSWSPKNSVVLKK